MAQTGNENELSLGFTVDGRDYRISVSQVERVLSLQRQAISPIPFGLGGRVLGLFRFRGAVLPLARISDTAPDQYGAGAEITVILLDTEERRFGIAVDSVREISREPYPGAATVSARRLYEGSTDSV